MFAFLPPATKLREGNVFTSMCQEFCPRGGGGMHGREACMVGSCMAGRHAWWGACIVGGMHGRGHVWRQDMHGGGCVWYACPLPLPLPTIRDTVNERVVRILLECIPVQRCFSPERNKYFRNVADGAKGCYTSEIRPYFSVWGGRCSLCLSNMHSSTFPDIIY